MPIPAGQTCENCQFYDPTTPPVEADRGWCLYTPPGSLRFNVQGWPRIAKGNWCSFWATIGSASGGSGLLPYDSGIGYRGSTATPQSVALGTAWTLLEPTFASVTNALNFSLQASGILRFDAPAGASPTLEVYATTTGIVTMRSGGNNEEVDLTIGVNGTAVDDYQNRFAPKNNGETIPVTVVAGLSLKDQDTISLFARAPTTQTIEFRNFHLLIEAFKVLTF